MYISNLSHFLDKTGNIPESMPSEGREMAGFLALIVDAATQMHSASANEVRCSEEGCDGKISSEISLKNDVEWKCSVCANSGIISGWQKTKWDNTKKS